MESTSPLTAAYGRQTVLSSADRIAAGWFSKLNMQMKSHQLLWSRNLATRRSSSGSSGAADNCRSTVLVPLSAVYKAW